MPRYFFNLWHRTGPGGLAQDHEGDELPDLDAAREHALMEARGLIARGRNEAVRDWTACSFEVTDERGRRVLTVPFGDTVPGEGVWE